MVTENMDSEQKEEFDAELNECGVADTGTQTLNKRIEASRSLGGDVVYA